MLHSRASAATCTPAAGDRGKRTTVLAEPFPHQLRLTTSETGTEPRNDRAM